MCERVETQKKKEKRKEKKQLAQSRAGHDVCRVVTKTGMSCRTLTLPTK